MKWLVIDAIGPFFRDFNQRRINWSKIPFTALATEGEERVRQWEQIAQDMRNFARQVRDLGYNTVTLDDLAHLVPHEGHEPEVARKIAVFREEFARLFAILHEEMGLQIWVTSDVLPMTAALETFLGSERAVLEDYYCDLVRRLFEDFPMLSGLVMRIGESDGTDVTDPLLTRLHVRTAPELNRLIKRLLPEFERGGRQLVLRTWTVGAHRIGDLIWHRHRLALALEGIESEHFIVSMKHGESDFFRYLPLNRAFFRVKQRKLIELQARREYEGAGEFPSFIGWDCERFARDLAGVEGMVGMSVWCQTGGWHRFRRLAFLEPDERDVWIRLNVVAAIRVFGNGLTATAAVEEVVGESHAAAALLLLHNSEEVLHELYYVEDYARQKLFFRRVRLPPLLHVYWDSIFVNQAVGNVLRHFVRDPEGALRAGESALRLFPQMREWARRARLPEDDIAHMQDVFGLIALARRYYFMPDQPQCLQDLIEAKKAYKRRWPDEERQRYRIKVSRQPFKVKRRLMAWAAALLLRKKRGYRLVDHMFTLHALGFAYRAFRQRDPEAMPDFLRNSAMGVDVLFK